MVIRNAIKKEITEYGITFPNMSSIGETGETFICSIVPSSFSLTIDMAVITTERVIKMEATRPGINPSLVFRSGLNQNIGSKSIGG